jgi:hypothetical protein
LYRCAVTQSIAALSDHDIAGGETRGDCDPFAVDHP